MTTVDPSPMRLPALFAAALVAAVLGGCDALAPVRPPPGAALPTLDSAAFRRAETLIAFFEHGELVKRFEAVYRHDDGRGYTVGWLGFTTSSGSAAEVVRRYAARAPTAAVGAPLRAFGPALDRLARTHDGDISALAAFPDAWRTASADTAFQRAQDDVARAWYFRPAQQQAAFLAGTGPPVSPLALATLYDIVVQHGPGPEDHFQLLDAQGVRVHEELVVQLELDRLAAGVADGQVDRALPLRLLQESRDRLEQFPTALFAAIVHPQQHAAR